MSDPLRKDLDTKTHAFSFLLHITYDADRSISKEAIVPDTSKSFVQRIKEAVTGSADRVAREVKPDDQKNIVQEAADKTERSKDNVKDGGTSGSITHKIRAIFHPSHPNHSHKH